MRRLFPLLFSLWFLFPASSVAMEIYSLVHNGCKAETGLIVHVDDETVQILNLSGKLAVLRRQEVELVLVYNLHDNPIGSLDLASGLKASLREVEVEDKESTHFIGWPIRFIEDLIIFYDTGGKTHLVDLARIKRFTYPETIDGSVKELSNHKPVYFDLGGNLPGCKTETGTDRKRVSPTRMISDKIQVHKFFSVYHTGFTDLKRFQKKTAFYPKPFLYEKQTRLGLVYTEEAYLQELHMPPFIYFQWSSGSPYASQGQYVLGSKSVDLLPMVEPQFVFRSDVKSHIFTGSFVGNLQALAGGSSYVIENRMLYTGFFSKISQDDHAVYPQFNYMVLTGVEYHEYAVSGGFYYPIFTIWGNGIFREIPSNRSSPVFRLSRTTKDLSLTLLYSPSRLHSDTPGDTGINLIKSSELTDYAIKSEASNQLIDSLSMYDLSSEFMRLNLLYDVSPELTLGMSEVLFRGTYREMFDGQAYALDFLHMTTSLSVKQTFSEYTALKGELNYFVREHDYGKGGQSGESNEEKLSFAISIEFFL